MPHILNLVLIYASIVKMSIESENPESRIGCGCSSFGTVILFGLIITALGVGVGGGCSARIPFTEANISVGGAVGKKEVVQQTLPDYLRNRVASNNNFFNHSGTLTVWVAEGMDVIVIGKQPEAPAFDLHISAAR